MSPVYPGARRTLSAKESALRQRSRRGFDFDLQFQAPPAEEGGRHMAENCQTRGQQAAVHQLARAGSSESSPLWMACHTAQGTGQQVLMLLQGVECHLQHWGQQLDVYTRLKQDCRLYGLPLPASPVLTGLPSQSLLRTSVQRYLQVLPALHAALQQLSGQEPEPVDPDAVALAMLSKALTLVLEMSEILGRISPGWFHDGQMLRLEQDLPRLAFLDRALSLLGLAPVACHALLALAQRFHVFSQRYGGS